MERSRRNRTVYNAGFHHLLRPRPPSHEAGALWMSCRSQRRRTPMMHPYMTFEDGTEVAHSQIIHDDGLDKVLVHFERPTGHGFDSTRCELPSYAWRMWEAPFSSDELERFEELLRNNAHLLYRYAANGGLKVA